MTRTLRDGHSDGLELTALQPSLVFLLLAWVEKWWGRSQKLRAQQGHSSSSSHHPLRVPEGAVREKGFPYCCGFNYFCFPVMCLHLVSTSSPVYGPAGLGCFSYSIAQPLRPLYPREAGWGLWGQPSSVAFYPGDRPHHRGLLEIGQYVPGTLAVPTGDLLASNQSPAQAS